MTSPSSSSSSSVPWPPGPLDRQALLNAYRNVLGWPLTPGAGPDEPTSVRCIVFDAVVLPHAVGVLCLGEDRGPAVRPAIDIGGELLVFLTLPGTGHLAVRCGGLVLSGPGDVLRLPPTPGHSWRTPPWDPLRPGPLPLPHGAELFRHPPQDP